MRHFDEAAFKRRWRALCQAHEVDSLAGATSYQVALFRAGRLTRPPGFWWRNPDFWAEREGYDGGCERPVEEEVFDSLWQQTRDDDFGKTLLELAQEFGEKLLPEIIREVRRELEEQGEIPLRHVHRRRVKHLRWEGKRKK